MSHRTQITLTDEQYERIREESERSGLPIAEIVRRALDDSLGTVNKTEVLNALNKSFGIWADLEETPEEYVDRMRPGLGNRLTEDP